MIKKTFVIETNSECLMERFERFLAFLHHNSNFGHSGLFAMRLDGDGNEEIKVTPEPGFIHEVDLCAGIGGGVEIAQDKSYTVKDVREMGAHWKVRVGAVLYRDGEFHKVIPMKP